MHDLDDHSTEETVWFGLAEQLAKQDPVLASIVDEIGAPPRMRVVKDLFRAIVLGIARQQLSAAAANAIFDRISTAAGNKAPEPADVVRLGWKQLNDAGLTAPRSKSLWKIACMFVDGSVDPVEMVRLAPDELDRELRKLPHVKGWTASMVLIFHYKLPNVLLTGDVALPKAVQAAYGLDHVPSDEEIAKIAESWAPFRSVASWYLWKKYAKFTPGLA